MRASSTWREHPEEDGKDGFTSSTSTHYLGHHAVSYTDTLCWGIEMAPELALEPNMRLTAVKINANLASVDLGSRLEAHPSTGLSPTAVGSILAMTPDWPWWFQASDMLLWPQAADPASRMTPVTRVPCPTKHQTDSHSSRFWTAESQAGPHYREPSLPLWVQDTPHSHSLLFQV